MARNIILVGDATSHGGAVVTGSESDRVDGRAIARQGDGVRCPIHGLKRIVEGDASTLLHGRPIALEGHRTECGATLIGNTANGTVG